MATQSTRSRRCSAGIVSADPGEQRSQHRGDPRRIVKHLSVGEANDLVTPHPQLDIPVSVVLECLAATVIAIAIGFDDQGPRLPEKIDGEAADGCIWHGHRQPMTAAEPQKQMLELASCELRISR
jgi:hypothetical protein